MFQKYCCKNVILPQNSTSQDLGLGGQSLSNGLIAVDANRAVVLLVNNTFDASIGGCYLKDCNYNKNIVFRKEILNILNSFLIESNPLAIILKMYITAFRRSVLVSCRIVCYV